jgi:hypothetical protein
MEMEKSLTTAIAKGRTTRGVVDFVGFGDPLAHLEAQAFFRHFVVVVVVVVFVVVAVVVVVAGIRDAGRGGEVGKIGQGAGFENAGKAAHCDCHLLG